MNASQILINADVIIFSCNSDATIIFQDGGGLAQHGLIRHQHVGLNAFEAFKDIPGFLDALRIALNGTKTKTVYKWGSDYCETHLTPLANGNVVGVCTTQTDRILRDIEREAANNIIMEERKKYITLTEISHISHELKTPLSAISGIINLMKDRLGKYFLVLERTIGSLHYMLDNILDFSKIKNGKIEIENIPFSPDDILDDIYKLFTPYAISKNIKLIINSNIKSNTIILGDPYKITQILRNFISNALKFCLNSIYILCEYNDDFIKFSVTDNGNGISKDKQELLFKPFSQTDNSITRKYGGTGLGLSICKTLAEVMNASIGYSNDNNDSVFWLQIKNIPSIIPDRLVIQTNFVQTTYKLKILIAEDTSALRFILLKYLHKLGYTDLCICINGLQVINNLKENKFDLVLLDNKMPLLNGIDVVKKAKELNIHQSIFIWMSSEKISLTDAYKSGFDDIIYKPINLNELDNVLKKFIKN